MISLLLATALAAEPAPKVEITPYGFFRPSAIVTSTNTSSYGRSNSSAITAAGNPALVDDPTAPHASWQVQQSRIGAKLKAGDASALVEMDFISFDHASPTVQANPRVRQVIVGWQASEKTKLTMGQTWDNFSPLMPFHRNYVGGNFQGGNVGFMRHQLIADQKIGGTTLHAAVGLAGVNADAADGNFERNGVPTGSVRWAFPIGEKSEWGVAGFATRLRWAAGDYSLAAGGSAYLDAKVGAKGQLKIETYIGQDLANTGMLTLSQGRQGQDVQDAGGWLSWRQGYGEHGWATTLTVGAAAVLNPDAVVPEYTVNATDPTAAGTLVLSSTGATHNLSARVGVEDAVTDHLSLFVEGFGYQTAWVHAPERTDLDSGALSLGAELGGVFSF